KNLYKLISLSHLEYFHRVPRIPRSELEKHREGLIVGSGCEKGELFEAALQKSPQEAEEIARFYDYIEIQPVDVNRHLIEKGIVESEERLRETNRLLVRIGEKLGKPVVATGNAHYLDEWESLYREILTANQNGFRRRSEERRVGKECRLRGSLKFSSRRRHTRFSRDWSSDVCSSDLHLIEKGIVESEERLRETNRLLVRIGEKLGKPVVATGNAHYLDEWESLYREILTANQNGFRRKDPLPPDRKSVV